MVNNAIQAILSLVLLIGAGIFLETRSWFKGGSAIVSKYCITIAMPCYMVYNITTLIPTRSDLLDIAAKLPIPLVVMLTGIVASSLLTKLFRVDTSRRSVVVVASSFANTVFIGFPVVQGLFGDEGLPVAMVYYMMSLTLFWFLGVYLMRRDSAHPTRFFSPEGLRKIFTAPPVIGLAIGILLVIFGITLPKFLFDALTRIQSTATPFAMMFIGSVIYSIDFREFRLSKDIFLVVVMKLIGLPLVMWAVCAALPIPTLHKQIFFSVAALPTMTQVGLMSKECGSDYKFASLSVGITTIISVLSVPFYAWIIERFRLF